MDYNPVEMVPPQSVSPSYEAMKSWHPERRKRVILEWALDGLGDIARTVAYRFWLDGDKKVALELKRIIDTRRI